MAGRSRGRPATLVPLPTVAALVLIDLPALVLVLALGSRIGYGHAYHAVAAWRLAHPWSFLPSLALAALIVRRWRRGAKWL